MAYANKDHAGSDDLDTILEMSREDHEITLGGNQTSYTKGPMYIRRQELKEEIEQFDAEIEKYEEELLSIKALIDLRKEERKQKLQELEATRASYSKKGKDKDGIDYGKEKLEWLPSLKARMKEVFGINSFRLCQEGVCNANMDGRDIVCVMPTGGGKSLTYQLPALLQPGCTLVISPLLSLINDQILHLKEAGIQAVKLTGTTSKTESYEITQRLTALASRTAERGTEIKLCYVTPEKIAKSKPFRALLQKLVGGSQLARIVIDEAHCVSQLGHDFRPDYKQLGTLRQLFPRVPIMALSATCPPKVLQDLIQTLGLKDVVDGNNADTQGTVYFTAPLYRKNLHYSVHPKPAKSPDVMKLMTDYILKHHPNESGIVYCLSKKDTESVAEALMKLSEGKIKTGVYHADRQDREKENLHVAWRRGAVNVVCATIAFGLGIDKGDVRFVLHHSLSKSLEGFYQESGRAGRDGKDSDCVLYYRPQDGTTLSSMVAHEREGKGKLRAMLSFAQNIDACRKTQFAKYFSHSSQLSMSSWTIGDSDALTRCGHCDNCIRPMEDIDRRNVTFETWQLLKIADAAIRNGANLTLNTLASLARGSRGGAYEVTTASGKKGKQKMKATEKLDLELVVGGAVELSKDDIEILLVELLIQKYLEEEYHQTPYTTNVYLILGPLAPRLMRLTRESLKDKKDIKVECLFRSRVRKTNSNSNAKAGPSRIKAKIDKKTQKPVSSTERGKRKRAVSSSEEEVEDQLEIVPDSEDEDMVVSGRPANTRQQRGSPISMDNDDDDDIDDWTHTMRSKGQAYPPPKKRRSSGFIVGVDKEAKFSGKVITENDKEVLVLSD